jgi:hypothetical protein
MEVGKEVRTFVNVPQYEQPVKCFYDMSGVLAAYSKFSTPF